MPVFYIRENAQVETDMIATKEDLVRLAQTLSQHSGLSLSTIGAYGANDGKLFSRWEAGGGCTLKTSAAFLRWFSSNWPAELRWPDDIPRPGRSKQEAA